MTYKDKNKAKEYQRLWYLKNKERKNKASHKNYIKNKEIICKRSILWRKNNPDKLKGIWKRSHDKRYVKYHDEILSQNKEWRRKNKEKIRKWRLEKYGSSDKPLSQRWRYSQKYYNWADIVYRLGKYMCKKCGARHCKLNAHHIKSAKDYPQLRYDVRNGVCLCEQCHHNIHYDVTG